MVLRLTALSACILAFVIAPTAVFGASPPVRFANALALVLLMRESRRWWPLLALAFFLLGLVGRVLSQAPYPLEAATINLLEVMLIATFLKFTGGLPKPWYRSLQAWRLASACLVAPLVTAGLAAAVITNVSGSWWERWLGWYSASVLGLFIVTPLLLSWIDPGLRQGDGDARWRTRRLVILVSVCGACAVLLLQEAFPPLLLLVFPLLVLVTRYYGLAGCTAGLAVVGGLSATTVLRDFGALVELLPVDATPLMRVQGTQLFLAALVLTTLPIAVLNARERRLLVNLRRSNDARAEFLSAMSHEIRTPLTGLMGAVDLLAAESLTSQQAKLVTLMRTSGRHLQSVLNDILDFSRIETGRLPLEELPFALSDVAEQVRSMLHPAALERGLELHLDLPAEPLPLVRGDPTRVRQVLLNLVGNAIKFTPQGQVTLAITAEASSVVQDGTPRLQLRCEVHDTGIGISPETLEHLFEPFSQADRSIARRYGGSGLGLAISRRLVNAMGGRIGVRSELGVGSTFALELTLPVAGEPSETAPAAEAPVIAPRVTPLRILVAEDVDANRTLLRAALTRQGHQVAFAHDGAEALAHVQREPVDLVLMDVQMPGMDGVEATRRIRRLPGAAARVPIVGLTANVIAQEQERYLAAGMDACLSKPIDWARLYAALAEHGQAAAGAVGTVALQAPQPAPADAPAAFQEPLLDDDQLLGLREIADAEELADMLRQALTTLSQAVQQMRSEGDAARAAQHAHRIKGTAGTLGLSRLAGLASAVEAECRAGRDWRTLEAALRQALADSEAELQGRALLR